jgi:hypothetical protein
MIDVAELSEQLNKSCLTLAKLLAKHIRDTKIKLTGEHVALLK